MTHRTKLKKSQVFAVVGAAFACLWSATGAAAESETPHNKAVQRLISSQNLMQTCATLTSASEDRVRQLISRRREQFLNDRSTDPQRAAKAWDAVEGALPRAFVEMKKVMSGPGCLEFLPLVLRDVYGPRLTTEELNATAAFYETDPGRRLLSLTPQLGAAVRTGQARQFMEAHFSQAEQRSLVAFLSSDTGKKFISVGSATKGMISDMLDAAVKDRVEVLLKDMESEAKLIFSHES